VSTARARAALPSSLPSSWRHIARDERRITHALRLVRRRITKSPEIDPVTSASIAQLHHVDDRVLPGIRRVGSKTRVRYVEPNGRTISNGKVLQRIKSLAIPPAWTDVWICPDPDGHLQATGRDARGRKQYRYHPQWRAVRDEVKYGRLLAFAASLPLIRTRTAADLRRPGLPREKVLAAVVQLLERTLIRVGNEEYARQNHSFGLTTLRSHHARVHGADVHFEFRGKSGVSHAVDLRDARLAPIIKACRDLPGHELFQYVDARGRRQSIGSSDVNAYLREISGQPFTSKDFRTWGGTVLAACALARTTPQRTKRAVTQQVVNAVKAVARKLGNTAAVCKKCYIHPAVLDAYAHGGVIDAGRSTASFGGANALRAEERAVVDLILEERDSIEGRTAFHTSHAR
jgi:DNA topoisomerase-1